MPQVPSFRLSEQEEIGISAVAEVGDVSPFTSHQPPRPLADLRPDIAHTPEAALKDKLLDNSAVRHKDFYALPRLKDL
jgi:hypothetical protein